MNKQPQKNKRRSGCYESRDEGVTEIIQMLNCQGIRKSEQETSRQTLTRVHADAAERFRVRVAMMKRVHIFIERMNMQHAVGNIEVDVPASETFSDGRDERVDDRIRIFGGALRPSTSKLVQQVPKPMFEVLAKNWSKSCRR